MKILSFNTKWFSNFNIEKEIANFVSILNAGVIYAKKFCIQ